MHKELLHDVTVGKLWITPAPQRHFCSAARLPKTVKPFVTPRFHDMAGYAQNMWISLWETASDPRGDGFWSVLLANSAPGVFVSIASKKDHRATFDSNRIPHHGPPLTRLPACDDASPNRTIAQ